MLFKLYEKIDCSKHPNNLPDSLPAVKEYQRIYRNKYNSFNEDRVFLFDTINGNQASNNGLTYAFTFNRNFTFVPRVGLAIYTMDFEYSSVFSCQVTGDTTITAASLFITTENTGNNNQLYIMYIATDHDYLGVFMPGPLSIPFFI